MQKLLIYLFIFFLHTTLSATVPASLYPLSSTKVFSKEMLQTAIEMNAHTEIVSVKNASTIPNLLMKKMRFKHIKTISPQKSGGRAYIAINKKKQLIIVFRGTDSDIKSEKRSNIYTDVQSLRKETMVWLKSDKHWKNIKAHRGFINEYSKFRDDIRRVVRKYKNYSIFVTGHSLGGALATLCAIDIRVNAKVPVTLYTSGSPRVGWGESFVEAFNRTVDTKFRIALKKDPVSLTPTKKHYKHVGNLLELYKNGKRVKLKDILPLAVPRVKNFNPYHKRNVYRNALLYQLNNCHNAPSSCYKKGILYKSAIEERKRKD